jgi:hypothetical protein
MRIGGFGTGPASKFATEKRKTPKRKLALLYLRISSTGDRPAIRSGSAGLDFEKGSLRCRFPVVFSYRARLPTRANSSVRACCVPRTFPKS